MGRTRLDAEAVVTAAAALADEDGLAQLTLARLASALGIRTPSLYSHVDGLADLLTRLGARGGHEMAAALQEAAAGRAGADALRAVADAYRAYAHAHPGTYVASQVAHDREDNRAAGAAAVGVFLAVLDGYGITGDAAIHAVRAVRSALHGFVALEREGGFGIALSVDESFATLVQMLDAGLQRGP
ncbi:MAG TPA: TetR-like C-terminal domain-containing protein [Solirubrobacteraceae bacterium]|nr:TetR-like C-terminal domain-containing protein [Solirubrobacteraceae bacterium]